MYVSKPYELVSIMADIALIDSEKETFPRTTVYKPYKLVFVVSRNCSKDSVSPTSLNSPWAEIAQKIL